MLLTATVDPRVAQRLKDIFMTIGGLTGVPISESVQWRLIRLLETDPMWYSKTTPYIIPIYNLVSVSQVETVLIGHGVPTGAATEVPSGLLYVVPSLIVGGSVANRVVLRGQRFLADELNITNTEFTEVFSYTFAKSGSGLLKPSVEAKVSVGGEGRVQVNDAEEKIWTETSYTTKEWGGRVLANTGSLSIKAMAVSGTLTIRTRGFVNEKLAVTYPANGQSSVVFPFPLPFDPLQQIEVVSKVATSGDHFATLVIVRVL